MEKKITRNSFFLCITETDITKLSKLEIKKFLPSSNEDETIEKLYKQLLLYYSNYDVIYSAERYFDKISKKELKFRLKTQINMTKFNLLKLLIKLFSNHVLIQKILNNILKFLQDRFNLYKNEIVSLNNFTRNDIIKRIRIFKWFDDRFRLSGTKLELINMITKYTIINTKTLYLADINDIPAKDSLILNNYKYSVSELHEYLISSRGANVNPYDKTRKIWIDKSQKKYLINKLNLQDIFKEKKIVKNKLILNIKQFPNVLKFIGEAGFICYNDSIDNYENNNNDEKLFSNSQYQLLKLREYKEMFNIIPTQFSLTFILNESDTCIHLIGTRLMILYLYCINLTAIPDYVWLSDYYLEIIECNNRNYITFSVNSDTKEIHILYIIPSLFYTILLGKYYYMNDYYHIDKLGCQYDKNNILESYYSVIIEKVLKVYPKMFKFS